MRKRLATRSMLLMTRRPSATTRGRVENRSSRRTNWATARDAELPEPMAIPMSASLRARTSLTPSPVMATVRPRACRARTMARFWWGVTRPNTERSASSPVEDISQRLGVLGQGAGIDAVFGPGNSGTASHSSHSGRMVA